MSDKPKYLVIFQPSGSRGQVEEGTTLLESARSLGVELESTCGGTMRCSKCRVRIEEGFFERFGIDSSMSHLSPMRDGEREFFKSRGIPLDGNFRQSCVTEVNGPVVVFVPEESRAVKQLIRKSARELNIEIKPAVKRYFVEMTKATLHEPMGDWERLCLVLKEKYGLENLTIDYPVLLRLQNANREGNWQLTVYVWQNREVIRVMPGFYDLSFGLAVDVGTTTVAGFLCDLDNGAVLATHSMMNPQTPYGDDVMARITYTMTHTDGLEKLHATILEGLNTIVRTCCESAGYSPEDIVDTVLVGNTCMDHIFLNIYPKWVGVSPFIPAIHHSVDVKARDFGLGILPSAYVHVLPNEAGFVGSDNMACVIAEEPYKQDDMMLIIDIGTNGEIVLGSRQKLISSSVPTGPAFEGAQIRYGMRAAAGAIERVDIDPVTWNVRYKVIGQDEWSDELPPEEIKARGICGSAIVELGWELYRAGVVDESGRFSKETFSPRLRDNGGKPEFVLAWANETSVGRDITFNVDDVRALQLAKSAMYCAAKIMMRRLGITKLDKIVLAGAFGSFIDKVKAMGMGLFPDCELRNVYAVGNAAGDGARIALLNSDKREEANAIARTVEYVELTVEKDFEKQFMWAMHFPHMQDEFPHLQRLLDKAQADRSMRLINNLPVFGSLPEKARRDLARAVQEKRYKKREVIFAQGTEPDAFYIVKEGVITLGRSNGSEQVLGDAVAGAFLDVHALLDGNKHSVTAKSNALNTRVLAIPRDEFKKLLAAHPEMMSKIRESVLEKTLIHP
jgi:uncharacterized 2Fe-2S/4Fe-4S cluster protein (DUF4445 family)